MLQAAFEFALEGAPGGKRTQVLLVDEDLGY